MHIQRLILLIVFLGSLPLLADNGKISGLIFGDAYWVAANHESSLKNQNGMWFRRIYFTYDHEVNSNFAMRFRLEANSPGDFTSREKLTPAVKDAYLKWKLGNHDLILGMSSSPTWNFLEGKYGYRWLEKTPIDLQRMGSSRDIGVALKGNLDEGKRVRYHLMVGNGNGDNSESNKGKKVMLAVQVEIVENLWVEGYGDYDARPEGENRYTGQAFLHYKKGSFNSGVQVARQIREQGGNSPDVELRFASVFANIGLGEKLAGLLRVDRMLDPNPEGNRIAYLPFDPNSKSTFVMAGLDIEVAENAHIMPNLQFVSYEAENGLAAPDSDLIPRVTFYYNWKE